MTYVISNTGKALMPCTNAIARLLLKNKKAKVIHTTPFTIKLLDETTNYTQPLSHGIDTGSFIIGSAVITTTNNVVYLSEITIRNIITDKMTQRASYRRNRRNRNTRYRPARYLNRKNSIKKDRFSPTMISKISSHVKEINFVKKILPITTLIIETGTFDIHALKNPKVLEDKTLYTKGPNYGYANTKAYVLTRDNYTCQSCFGKKKDSKLEIHHIVYRSNGGSDEAENLLTLCHTCHTSLHAGKIELKSAGKKKGNLKHATQMNSIRKQLLRQVECIETFGYITKENRQKSGMEKTHYSDAIYIAAQNSLSVTFSCNILYKKCVADGDYQLAKGIRSEQVIPVRKIHGFRKFDKVRYLGNEYFIMGRMSSGYAILMDIFGKKVDFSNAPKGMKTPKMANMVRISARKSWIMKEEIIPNIC